MKVNGEYVKSGRFEDISFKHENKPITFSTSYILNRPQKYRHNSHKKANMI